MGKQWVIRPDDSGRAQDLSRAANIPRIVAQLLVCRGITRPQTAVEFLGARLKNIRDPHQLPGLKDAVQVVHAAVEAGKPITIYGDYDADGMTSTAILVRCLRLLGARVDYYLPHRIKEGYGVNEHAIRKLSDRGTRLIVSVDCGITSVDEIQLAKQLGLDFVVLDHHAPSAQLPPADAIVHPGLGDYPFAGLCGAGVTFKFAWALCQLASHGDRVTERLRNFLIAATGLAAIGTVADVVPLVDENRLIVRHGLNALLTHPGAGIQALLDATPLRQRERLASEDIAFTIAPRLNAVGRIGQAELGVELLTTDSADRAKDLAQYVEEMNEGRSTMERSIYLAANKQIKDQVDLDAEAALVLADRGWHPGVIGIVAGRLADKYARPVVMIALDDLGRRLAVGSARSALGVDLHGALDGCRSHLMSFGGHAAAAGLRIDEAHVESFRQAFCRHVADCVPLEQRQAQLMIDAESPLAQLTLQTVSQIEQLAPFGEGNPRPLLCASNVQLDGDPRTMGGGGRHLSVKLRQGALALRAVAFGHGDEWAPALMDHQGCLDVAYRPVINHFGGRRSVELHLVDWRPAIA